MINHLMSFLNQYLSINLVAILYMCCIILLLPIDAAVEENGCTPSKPGSIAWCDCDGVPWILDGSTRYDGNSSIRSGSIEYMGVSSICWKISGPIDVSFQWKTDVDQDHGRLLLFVDNAVRSECNSRNWSECNFSIRDNKTHVIKYQFKKLKSDPKWHGAGWIDAFRNIAEEQTNSETRPGQPDGSSQTTGSTTTNPTKSPTSNDIIETYKNTTNKTRYVDKRNYSLKDNIYMTINEAICASQNGDIIEIKPDLYHESIIIDKPLEIRRMSGVKYPLICDDNFNNKSVITVRSDDVIINGLEIKGYSEEMISQSKPMKAISTPLGESHKRYKNISIKNVYVNKRSRSEDPILTKSANCGISLSNCDNVDIKDCELYNIKSFGIWIDDCSNVSIINNTLINRETYSCTGIYVYTRNDVPTISNNNINHFSLGINYYRIPCDTSKLKSEFIKNNDITCFYASCEESSRKQTGC